MIRLPLGNSDKESKKIEDHLIKHIEVKNFGTLKMSSGYRNYSSMTLKMSSSHARDYLCPNKMYTKYPK